jgi:Fe-S-cluster containining protein
MRALDFYILSDGVPTPVGLARIPSVRTEKGPAFIALKKMKNGDCIFLKDDLCMIHAMRPGVCRSFPFTFADSEDVRRWGLSAKKEICPGLGIGPQITEDEIDHLADSILPELKIFENFADDWNESQASPTALSLLDAILSDQRFYTSEFSS